MIPNILLLPSLYAILIRVPELNECSVSFHLSKLFFFSNTMLFSWLLHSEAFMNSTDNDLAYHILFHSTVDIAILASTKLHDNYWFTCLSLLLGSKPMGTTLGLK